MAKIIELAELIEYLARKDVSNKAKASAVKLAITDGIVAKDDGLELIIYYT